MLGQIPLLSTITSLLLLSNSALALPPQSANTRTLMTRQSTGTIDVDRACGLQHGSGWRAQAVGNSCNDWKCVRGNERRGVDLESYCCAVVAPASCRYVHAYCLGKGVYDWICYWGI